jgi:hypothetical protein
MITEIYSILQIQNATYINYNMLGFSIDPSSEMLESTSGGSMLTSTECWCSAMDNTEGLKSPQLIVLRIQT